MREVELKSIVDDVAQRRKLVERAGGRLTFEGGLKDRRYDNVGGELVAQDNVLRLRIYESPGQRTGFLDWKGPTSYEDGYQVREEISTEVGDPDVLAIVLGSVGFSVVLEVDRQIAQYTVGGAVVRFEEYPKMDPLVEVEGTPEEIEKAIGALGMERSGFSSDRLPAFVSRYEARTGDRAALSARELAGDYRFARTSA
jgi:adenylate cyclase class IV